MYGAKHSVGVLRASFAEAPPEKLYVQLRRGLSEGGVWPGVADITDMTMNASG